VRGAANIRSSAASFSRSGSKSPISFQSEKDISKPETGNLNGFGAVTHGRGDTCPGAVEGHCDGFDLFRAIDGVDDELVGIQGRPSPIVHTGHGIYPLILAFMDFRPKFYVQARVTFKMPKSPTVPQV
jgi:hypothetical protein